MAFADFTLDDAVTKLGVRPVPADLFPGLTPAAVPSWLPEALAAGPQLGLNEKARSEFLVAPILAAARVSAGGRLAVFSGARLDVDPTVGLVGECDFILSAGPEAPPLRAPLLTVVEAKRGDIDLGMGQCMAQMVAADRFNQAAGVMGLRVYGCVTTGELWQFLRLAGSRVESNHRRLFVAELGLLLAALLSIANQSPAVSPAGP